MIHRATMIAADMHEGQKRKTNGYPYLVHPLEVGQLLMQYDCTDAEIAAGICHDTVEDCKKYSREEVEATLRRELGDDVADLVLSVSEQPKSVPKLERKEEYLGRMKTASASTLKVLCADKVNNLESLLHSLRKYGPEHTWSKFTDGKDRQKWFYETVVSNLKDLLPKFKDDEVILSMYIQLGSYYRAVFLKQ